MERIFVDAFIANGGKGEEAALTAGYSASSAKVSACRLLCRQRVAAQIKTRCETFAHATLPVAIRCLLEICETAPLPKDRIKAANSLIELAGMVAPRGGISVNVGIVNGSAAQQVIAEVWNARTARLSDIPTAMPDTFEDDMRTIEGAALPAPAAPRGGIELQGPSALPVPVPVPSTTKVPKTAISCECPLCRDREPIEGDDAAAEFRRAFEEDDDG
jgi:hypothetical protein